MRRPARIIKIITFDIAGVLCIIAAPLTGWLPGPGGIPLLLLGLSLIAVHHAWAERYLKLLEKYASRLGSFIFRDSRRVRLLYDIMAPLLIMGGSLLFGRKDSFWMMPMGTALVLFGMFIFLGNRRRYLAIQRASRSLRHKRPN